MDINSVPPVPPEQNQTPVPAIPETPSSAKKLNPKLITIIVAILVLGGVAYGGFWWWGNRQAENTADWQIYRNEQYGFEISLPESWKGYSVLNNQWEGRDVANGKIIFQGPLIVLRHPQWTETSQREDVPVMVITKNQFTQIQNGFVSVGAAPVPPTLLTWNTKYNFALPARYNYAFKTGWEEVDQLVRTLKTFEPTIVGKFCGGIAGIPCPSGFACKLDGTYPDAGGTCVKEDEICVQVITPAQNKITGEIREFPTPCDVPEGWEMLLPI